MNGITERMIRESLVSLLERHSADDITVHLLCVEAGISRQTFYNHYYSLIDAYDDCFVKDLIPVSSEETRVPLLSVFGIMLNTLYNYKRIYLHLFRSSCREELMKSLSQILYSAINREIMFILKQFGNNHIEEDVIQFMKNTYLSCYLGITQNYIAGDLKEQPEFVLDMTRIMLEGNIESTVIALLSETDESDLH